MHEPTLLLNAPAESLYPESVDPWQGQPLFLYDQYKFTNPIQEPQPTAPVIYFLLTRTG